MGIDHGLMTHVMRWVLAEVGIIPKALLVSVREQLEGKTHNTSAIPAPAMADNCEFLEEELMEMYGFSKKHVRSLKVDFVIDEDHPLPGMEFYHVPGHCSGQVAIRLGDILLSADHILPRTSPHLAAESITHYTGVGHYRDSLRKVAALDGVRLTLGGHESPIEDLHARVRELQSRLDLKAERVLDILRRANHPLTISEISKQLYADRHGFDVLLALQEAGAHVEYLYDRGYLAVANLHEFEHDDNPSLMYSVL